MLNLRNRLRTSIVAALTLTIAVSGIVYAAAPSVDSGAKGKIEGSGATFPWNQYKDWFSSFTDENSEDRKSTRLNSSHT